MSGDGLKLVAPSSAPQWESLLGLKVKSNHYDDKKHDSTEAKCHRHFSMAQGIFEM